MGSISRPSFNAHFAFRGYPELAVLIGRLSDSDQELLDKAQAREPDVRIVTYDEVLQHQQHLLT
jgi:hypothetical protein